jgi:hypothetical protein
VVFVTTWPVVTLAPATGLDPSWQAALHMAAHERIGFGDELVFTYGPLGFLNFPLLYYSITGALAGLYVVALWLAVSLSLVWAARRAMSLPIAFGFALLAAGALPLAGDAVVVPVFIWCVAILLDENERFASKATVLPVGAGVVAGTELLAKLNVGLTVLALFVITLAALPTYKRALLIFTPSFVVTALVAWLVLGGSFSQIWPYVLNVGSIFSGYSSAMQSNDPDAQWWLPFGVSALIGLGLGGVYSSSSEVDRRRRIAAALLWAILSFMAFKSGFVRAGVDRKALFFGVLLGAMFAFPWRPGRYPVAVVSLGVAVALFFGATNERFADVVQPFTRADRAFDQLKTMVDSNRRKDLIDDTRSYMRKAYRLDAESRRLAGDAPVHIYPHEDTVAWAYELNWKPLPVFQSYSAYTTRLDELNADALASPDGPEVILRRPEPAVDSRNATFDSPAAVVSMICNYDELRATGSWEVLRRVDDRCGVQRPLVTVKGRLGDKIPIPTGNSHEMVLARVQGVQVSGRERLRAFLYRARERFVAINGITWRFVPGTAADGLLLRMPRKADWSSPYGFAGLTNISAGNANVLAFYGRNPKDSQHIDRELTISFYAMPIRPSRAAHRLG